MSKDNTGNDTLISDWFGDGEDPARYDPVRAARASQRRDLPRRFYKQVSTETRAEGEVLLLDGRPARTRARNILAVETPAAAALLVAEWAGQGEIIDPSTMPVTRILHAVIDHVAAAHAAVVADILKYAGSDLVCYRAGEPERLVELEAQHWDPVLAHARDTYGARFILVEGIGFVAQPEAALAALEAPIARRKGAALAALHVLTTISGSALIALGVADRAISPEAGFAAGEVDGDFEVSVWGQDDEGAAFRAARRVDFLAAAALLDALGG